MQEEPNTELQRAAFYAVNVVNYQILKEEIEESKRLEKMTEEELQEEINTFFEFFSKNPDYLKECKERVRSLRKRAENAQKNNAEAEIDSLFEYLHKESENLVEEKLRAHFQKIKNSIEEESESDCS